MNKAEDNNKNRTGISVQMSAGVTTAGTGLSSNEDKSPVTTSFKTNEETANELGEVCDTTEVIINFKPSEETTNELGIVCDTTEEVSESCETIGEVDNVVSEEAVKNNSDATITEATILDGLALHGDMSPVVHNDHSSQTHIQSSENEEITQIIPSMTSTNHADCSTTGELDTDVNTSPDATTTDNESTIPDDFAPHGDKLSLSQNNDQISQTNIQSSENQDVNTSNQDNPFVARTNHAGCSSTAELDTDDGSGKIGNKNTDATNTEGAIPNVSSLQNDKSPENPKIINTVEKKMTKINRKYPRVLKEARKILRRELHNKPGIDDGKRAEWAIRIIDKYKDLLKMNGDKLTLSQNNDLRNARKIVAKPLNKTGIHDVDSKLTASRRELAIGAIAKHEATIAVDLVPHRAKSPVPLNYDNFCEIKIEPSENPETSSINKINPFKQSSVNPASTNQLSSMDDEANDLVSGNFDPIPIRGERKLMKRKRSPTPESSENSSMTSTNQLSSAVPVSQNNDDNSSPTNIQPSNNQEIINTAEKKSSASNTDSQPCSLPKKIKKRLKNARRFLKKLVETGVVGDAEQTARRVKYANNVIAKYADAETGGNLTSIQKRSLEAKISHVAQNNIQTNNQSSGNKEIINTVEKKSSAYPKYPKELKEAGRILRELHNKPGIDGGNSKLLTAERVEWATSIIEKYKDFLAIYGDKSFLVLDNDYSLPTNKQSSENQGIININTAEKTSSASTSTTDNQPLCLANKTKRNQEAEELQKAKRVLMTFVSTGIDAVDAKLAAERVGWANRIIAKYTDAETGGGDLTSTGERSFGATISVGLAPHGKKSTQNIAHSSPADMQLSSNQRAVNRAEKKSSICHTDSQPRSLPSKQIKNANTTIKKFGEAETVVVGDQEQTAKSEEYANNIIAKHTDAETGRSGDLTSLQNEELQSAKRVLETFVWTAERMDWANSIIAKYKDALNASDSTSTRDNSPVVQNDADNCQTNIQSFGSQEIINKAASVTDYQRGSTPKYPIELKQARRILRELHNKPRTDDDGNTKLTPERVEWATSIIEKYKDLLAMSGDKFFVALNNDRSCPINIQSSESQTINIRNRINPSMASTNLLKQKTRGQDMRDARRVLAKPYNKPGRTCDVGSKLTAAREWAKSAIAKHVHEATLAPHRAKSPVAINNGNFCEIQIEPSVNQETSSINKINPFKQSSVNRASLNQLSSVDDGANDLVSGNVDPIAVCERKQMKRKRSPTPEPSDYFNEPDILEQYNDVNPPPRLTTPAMFAGVEENIFTFNHNGKRLKWSSNLHKFKVTLPNQSISSDEFLKVVKKQNGLHTESWTLTSKKPWTNMFKAWYLVDQDSYEQLQQTNNNVYFFFEKVKLEFCEDE